MKGWEFTGTNEPLVLVEKPDPVAAPGTVIIEVKAAGLCHSDVATLRDPGWMKILAKVPIILGHEIAGVITEVGEGVTDFAVGDRVGVCPVGKDGLGPGNGRDGGYADKVLVPAVDLVPIPEGVTFAQAAAGTDAGMTSYHAMFQKGGAKAGMKVGVIGIGGLGQMAARAAVVAGCDVYAVDLSPAARDLAKEIGCKEVFENVSDLAAVAPELIVDYAGFGTTTADAIDAVAVGGTVVLVGMGKLQTTINTSNLILKSVQLKGSVGGTVEDVAAVYELMAQGHLNPTITEITFDEISDGLGRLERHEVTGRLVANLE
ncbi:alcohol dehydrogenase [Mesobacillus campisalis]|uniref:Alcohol dehydrogenase n=1 Tax=Mesobacillus campisalis TaxID=1408103 RepID=A0A0M2T418_9BACI|nr:zinc-binding dehydrogenase [Mesobacillus campisalis]KKK40002.1 alcohol dehydrogenase [Mesobacillus campisalis]